MTMLMVGALFGCGSTAGIGVTAPAVTAATAPPTTASEKRGAAFHFCGWPFSEGSADLEGMVPGLAWYYNWSSAPLVCEDGHGVGAHPLITGDTVEFVPMAWGLVDEGRHCAEEGPCFRVDERAGGAPCRDVCDAVSWSFDPSGACYACYHQGITRQEFLADVPRNARHLLGYNEPNFKEQANLTPEVAARGWRHLEWVADRRGLTLVGPSTNFCDSTPGVLHPGACIEAVDGHKMLGLAWLERFYDACRAEGAAGHACRIEYQSVHAYSCGGVMWMIQLMKGKAGLVTPDAAHCHNGIQDEDEFGPDCGGNICTACTAHARAQFRKPVWLTEFGTPKDDCRVSSPEALQARTLQMMNRALPRLESDPYVARYAWFMPKVDMDSLDHVDLLVEDKPGVLSVLGRYYFGR